MPQDSATKLQPKQQPNVQRYSKMSKLSNTFAEKNIASANNGANQYGNNRALSYGPGAQQSNNRVQAETAAPGMLKNAEFPKNRDQNVKVMINNKDVLIVDYSPIVFKQSELELAQPPPKQAHVVQSYDNFNVQQIQSTGPRKLGNGSNGGGVAGSAPTNKNKDIIPKGQWQSTSKKQPRRDISFYRRQQDSIHAAERDDKEALRATSAGANDNRVGHISGFNKLQNQASNKLQNQPSVGSTRSDAAVNDLVDPATPFSVPLSVKQQLPMDSPLKSSYNLKKKSTATEQAKTVATQQISNEESRPYSPSQQLERSRTHDHVRQDDHRKYLIKPGNLQYQHRLANETHCLQDKSLFITPIKKQPQQSHLDALLLENQNSKRNMNEQVKYSTIDDQKSPQQYGNVQMKKLSK